MAVDTLYVLRQEIWGQLEKTYSKVQIHKHTEGSLLQATLELWHLQH